MARRFTQKALGFPGPFFAAFVFAPNVRPHVIPRLATRSAWAIGLMIGKPNNFDRLTPNQKYYVSICLRIEDCTCLFCLINFAYTIAGVGKQIESSSFVGALEYFSRRLF